MRHTPVVLDDEAGLGALSSIFRAVHVLLLGAWAGAGLLLIGSVELREEILEILFLQRSLDQAAVIAFPIIAFTLLAGWLPQRAKIAARALGLIALGVLTFLTRTRLTPEILSMRQALSTPLKALAETDPARIQIENLQTLLDWSMTAQTALAALLVFAAMKGAGKKRSDSIEL